MSKLDFFIQILHLIVVAIDIYILVYLLKMQKSSYECKCAQVQYLKQITNTIIIILYMIIIITLYTILDYTIKQIYYNNYTVHEYNYNTLQY